MAAQKTGYSLKQSQEGFTLIEVLVAIVILSVGLLGMASLTGSIVRYNKLSNDRSAATTLAQDKLEEVRANGYSSAEQEDPIACTGNFSEYKRGVTVSENTALGTKQIAVKVSWGPSDAHDVEIKTILCE